MNNFVDKSFFFFRAGILNSIAVRESLLSNFFIGNLALKSSFADSMAYYFVAGDVIVSSRGSSYSETFKRTSLPTIDPFP